MGEFVCSIEICNSNKDHFFSPNSEVVDECEKLRLIIRGERGGSGP